MQIMVDAAEKGMYPNCRVCEAVVFRTLIYALYELLNKEYWWRVGQVCKVQGGVLLSI